MGTWLDEYKASVSLDEEKAAFVPVSSREIVIKITISYQKSYFG